MIGLTANLVAGLAGASTLILLPWLLVFGGLGGLLSWERGGLALEGTAIGLLGPVGWVLIWIRTGDRAGNEPQDERWDRWSTL